MALTGKFEADFSAFNTEVDTSTAKLAKMEQQGKTVGPAVAQGLNRVTPASDASAQSLTRFGTALQAADKTLGVFGVNIGRSIGALKELGEASGKSATQIGLVGTAGLVAGAAIGGWELGRAIAGWLGLDKAIGDATAKLMGFGDVAAATAAAQADVLAKASKIAGKNITDLGQAMLINAEYEKKHAEQVKRTSDAMLELNAVSIDYQKTLDTVDGSVAEAVKFYLELGVSQKSLADAYLLTREQVDAIKQSLDAQKERAQNVAASFADLVKSYEDFAKKMGDIDREQQQLGNAERDKALKERNTQVQTSLQELQVVEKENADFTMRMTMEATDYQIAKIRQVAAERIATSKAEGQQLKDFTAAVQAGAQQQIDAILGVTKALSAEEAAMARLVREGQTGVAVIGGGPSSNLRPDTQSRIQAGPAGGTAYTLPSTVNMTVSGVLDPRTIADLANAVGKQLMGDSARQFPSR